MTDETKDFDSTDEPEDGDASLPEDIDRLLERAEGDSDDEDQDGEEDEAPVQRDRRCRRRP